MIVPLPKHHYEQLILLAKAEDVGAGDWSAIFTIDAQAVGIANIVTRTDGVICGMTMVPDILAAYDFSLVLSEAVTDGTAVTAGQSLGKISGPLRALVTSERVVLNFLQRLSGIATMTAQCVALVAGTGCDICDTRKTTPGYRQLEKYSVKCGGGVNHRMGLYDGVMVKDNHWIAIGAGEIATGLEHLLTQIKTKQLKLSMVEIEVDTLAQLKVVLAFSKQYVGINIILLDNMSCEDMKQAVAMRNEIGLFDQIQLEASGNVTLDALATIAQTGVERISLGCLTHSVKSLDIGLDMQ